MTLSDYLTKQETLANAATLGAMTADGEMVVADDGGIVADNCTESDAELFAASRESIPKLCAVARQLMELLKRYGHHSTDCSWHISATDTCTCGLTAAINIEI